MRRQNRKPMGKLCWMRNKRDKKHEKDEEDKGYVAKG